LIPGLVRPLASDAVWLATVTILLTRNSSTNRRRNRQRRETPRRRRPVWGRTDLDCGCSSTGAPVRWCPGRMADRGRRSCSAPGWRGHGSVWCCRPGTATAAQAILATRLQHRGEAFPALGPGTHTWSRPPQPAPSGSGPDGRRVAPAHLVRAKADTIRLTAGQLSFPGLGHRLAARIAWSAGGAGGGCRGSIVEGRGHSGRSAAPF
jgi:hypothetical protein